MKNNCLSQIRVILVVAMGVGLPNPCLAQEPRLTLSQLSLEVSALQTLRNLNVSAEQLKALRQLAKQTITKAELRKEGKGTEKFRTGLVDLHKALLSNTDQEKIEDLTDKLESIRDSEKPELDDDIEITDQARQRAADAVRLFGAGQVAAYLAGLAADVDDPREHLVEAVAKVRELSPEKWKEVREELSALIGRLSAGLDAEKADRIGDEAVRLLIVVRSLSDAEFKSQKAELEKKALKIVGDVGPFDVLHHIMEYTLAELLSNPRLPQVIEARLKQEPANKPGPKQEPEKKEPEKKGGPER